MKPYSKLTKEELKKLKGQLEKQFEEVKAKGIHLDMSVTTVFWMELQRQENYWQICQKYQREIF